MYFLRVLRHASYQAVAKTVTAGVGFLATVIIARSFGVVGYGDFTKITAFVGIFYWLSDFGLNAVFLRKDRTGSHFKDLFYLRLLIAVGVIAVVNGIAYASSFNDRLSQSFPGSIRLGIAIYSFSLLAQSLITTAGAAFQKTLRYQLHMGATVVGSLIYLALLVVFVQTGKPLSFILFSYIAGTLITGIVAIFWTKEKLFPPGLHLPFVVPLLKESLPLAMTLLFSLVYFRADVIILSLYRKTAEVGAYGLSYKFFDFLIALPLFLSNVVYPTMLVHKEKYPNFFPFLSRTAFFYLAVSLLITAICWLSAPLLVLVKADFLPSVVSFRLLALSLPLFFLSSLFQWALIALEKQGYLLRVYILSTALNVLLNLVFIPFYGYTAAAVITGVSELFVCVMLSAMLWSLWKNTQIEKRI